MSLFQLEWMGGPSERLFRRLRPATDGLPWASLDARSYPPELVERARLAYTQGAFNEYCTAAAMAAFLQALLQVSAPVDLVGMAGGFVADEMAHVELNARMAMELGGAVPCEMDFAQVVHPAAQLETPEMRMLGLAVAVCCVSETFSAPLLAATARAASHPLTRGVLSTIARDEPRHALLGWLVLDWARPLLTPQRCVQLAELACAELHNLGEAWRDLPASTLSDERRRAVTDLGWLPAEAYAALAKRVVWHDIVDRLATYGIALPNARVIASCGERPESTPQRRAS